MRPVGDVWWLEQALAADPGAPCPPLAGTTRADVCIVGGGYTGLWTAIELREQSPDVSVVLIEADGCGFGPSGRNGGWATGWHDELDNLVRQFGVDEALRLAERSSWAISRLGEFAAEHGIDCDFRQEGALWSAATPRHLGAWDSAVAACREHGRGEMLELLDGDDLEARTGSPLPLAGVRHVDAAAVQPAQLARGLRRVALELGVSIHEGTPMTGLERTRPAVVRTPAGSVEADRVVLALNAWSGRIRELRRSIVPVGSHIVLSGPVGDRLDGTRFRRGELLGDSRLMVHYAQVTVDGRVAFGRGGGAVGPLGRVVDRHYDNPAVVAEVVADFRRWFPALADVPVEHAWGGPIDRAPGHLPFTGVLGDHENVHYGLGYSGNGVAPSAFVGRILGRAVLGIRDADTQSPLAAGPRAYLPPEPLRFLGGAAVRAGVARAEAAEERGERAGWLAGSLRHLVAASVPARIEPRLRSRRD